MGKRKSTPKKITTQEANAISFQVHNGNVNETNLQEAAKAIELPEPPRKKMKIIEQEQSAQGFLDSIAHFICLFELEGEEIEKLSMTDENDKMICTVQQATETPGDEKLIIKIHCEKWEILKEINSSNIIECHSAENKINIPDQLVLNAIAITLIKFKFSHQIFQLSCKMFVLIYSIKIIILILCVEY